MKNITHYLFSLGLTNLFLLSSSRSPLMACVTVILSLFCSFMSLIPNFLDQQVSINFESNGVYLPRYRHPLSHSPWTMLYFIPIIYLTNVLGNEILQILSYLMAISWLSHLILDSFDSGGIPLGRKPIYSNHPIKHYQFKISDNKIKRLRFIKISGNKTKFNGWINYFGLFFFSLNLSNAILSVAGF